MVEKAEFFRVADEIRAEGRQPSQRNIRERLAKGGSFSELGPLYVEWAVARDYYARPTREDLPDRLREKVEAFAAEIWSEGRRSASEALQEKARAAIAERDAVRLALAVASARVDDLEQMLALRTPGADGDGVEPIREPAVADGEDARAFWNRVMQVIFELLGERTLAVDDVLAALPPEIAAEAIRRDRLWGPSRLAQKLRERAKRGRFFLEPEEGVFRRLAEAA
jgi:hypothetical protein